MAVLHHVGPGQVAEIDPDTQWVLKGGYAMDLRFQIARATKDLDFTVRAISGAPGDALLEHLQEAGRRDLKDFFYSEWARQ